MPRTIDEGFREFLTTLTPSSTESDAAKAHRASVEACLAKNFTLRRFVRIGSFGNGTSISGFSDVDYLAEIPFSQLGDDSTAALVRVRKALEGRFPFSDVRVNCPAVSVPFGNSPSEKTEVVPALYLRDSSGNSVYNIADCAGDWSTASPDTHNGYVAAVDRKLDGKVKPLIRFIKAWKYFQNVPISSFYLELRVAKYADSQSIILHYWDLRSILCQLRDAELPSLQDPTGVSGYIAPCKTQAMRTDALSKLETAAGRADRALIAAKKDDVAGAFDAWRLLFNYEFPSYHY